jgi:hypothetical protein
MLVGVDPGDRFLTIGCRFSWLAGSAPMRRHERYDRGDAG